MILRSVGASVFSEPRIEIRIVVDHLGTDLVITRAAAVAPKFVQH
jgi:hypothetical protein